MTPVGGSRHYDGPGMAAWAPWNCPACHAENTGSIDDGCASCGSGTAKATHVGVAPPSTTYTVKGPPIQETFTATPPVGVRMLDLQAYAHAWLSARPEATAHEAFIAGYEFAMQQAQARTMTAPPVTADLPGFSPDGKVRRTIIAALELFKDQVLRGAKDEIASGEWCSIEEVEQVIADLQKQETQHG